MSLLKIWIVESRHIDPIDLFVKVDQSEYYVAYWLACSGSEASAQALVLEMTEDLALGKSEVMDAHLYNKDFFLQGEDIRQAIEERVKTFEGDQEQAQLAAWVTKNGGLW